MPTIPAKEIVSVTPGTVGAGGSGLVLNGMFLTENSRVPIGTVLSFANDIDVSNYFGGSSVEAAKALVYFAGFDNSNIKPDNMLITQYPLAAVSAYLRGGSTASLSLTQLQALSVGTLTVAMDGVPRAGTGIDLSGASSFSAAATIIATALNTGDPTEASFTAAIAATTMTVSAVASGTLAPGLEVLGAGVTASTTILSQLTGSPIGGVGTYEVSISQTVGSEAMTAKGEPVAVTFDSVSKGFVVTSGITGALSTSAFATGSLAASLFLTSASGAVLSQGADAASPSAFMTALTGKTQNWATFTTMFDPDNGGGIAQKLLFSEWNSTQNNRYAYICWDTDTSPTLSPDASGSLGQAILNAEYSGTCLIWQPSDLDLEDFICGAAASIDFTETAGRITFAFKGQSGIVPSVTDATVADNLIANGYNFYGAYATANQAFQFFYPGKVSGPFNWLDSYVDEIQINNALQLAIMEFMTTAKSIPYNQSGYSAIETSCADVISNAINFGSIVPGVTLSSTQASEVNTEAGTKIDDVLSTRGWYFQIKDAPPDVRSSRGSPPATFWYVDGESVQKINLASLNVQ